MSTYIRTKFSAANLFPVPATDQYYVAGPHVSDNCFENVRMRKVIKFLIKMKAGGMGG